MRVYTRTGDKGETGLFGNERVAKNSARIVAIGAIDEVNAALGAARQAGFPEEIDSLAQQIQSWIFDLGAELSDRSGAIRANLKSATALLETSMDQMERELEPLRTFVLPGGCAASALLHVARTICRRAELAALQLAEKEPVGADSLVFLNRLSDWMFVAARFCNLKAGVADVHWTKFEG